MVPTYTVFGRQVGSHVLAMVTLGTFFGGIALSMGGGKKTPQAPPINAGSKDEENFVKKFLEQADADEKKTTKH